MASRYAVRGEPISFMQACLEDDDYLMQFERALEHSAANVRQLARCILDEAQAYEQLDRLPEAMQERIGQLWEKAHRRDSDGPGGPPSSGSLPADEPDAAIDDDPKPSPPMAKTVRTVPNKVLNKVLMYCTEQGQSEEPSSARDARARFQQLPPDQQRYLSERLKGLPPQQRQDVLAGGGSLIPSHKTYILQRHVYDGQCKAAGLSNMHGLQHQYAQMRYEALNGVEGASGGWALSQSAESNAAGRDSDARQTIIRELGHERIQITAIYLGS